jgi:four helix bundle protein
MNKKELEQRTKRFCISTAKRKNGGCFGLSTLESGKSVGGNYREANRAQSRNDFIHKIAIVEKESAESEYWLELFNDSNIGEVSERQWLLAEAGELLAIFTSIGRSTKQATPVRQQRARRS